MPQKRARFNRPGSDKPAGPLGTIIGVAVHDDGTPVVVLPDRSLPVRDLQANECMVVAAFLGRGREAYNATDKWAVVARMIREHAGNTTPPTPPTPTPDPIPDPIPTPEDPMPDPTTTPGVLIPATVDGVPTFLTPDDIRGDATPVTTTTRIIVTIPERADVELPDVHHAMLPDVLSIMAAAESARHLRNIMLIGPAGTGKSTMPQQAAAALGISCRSVSCGPADNLSTWLGFIDANGEYRTTAFRDAYEHGGVLIIDEMDNSHPGVLTKLNQALADDWMEFPDGKVARHPSLRVIATANTFGLGPDRQYVGRQQLDAATLNRFPVQLTVGYDPGIDENAAMQYATPELRDRMRAWLDWCLTIRDKAMTNRVPVIVSPRNIEAGAALIAAGFDTDKVKGMTVLAGLKADVLATLGV